jgi:asparagine N-glycosylation enzyme membrane subunit Stt3
MRLYEKAINTGKISQKDYYGSFPDELEIKYPPFHLRFLLEISYFLMMFLPEKWWGIDFLIGWIPPFFGWMIGLLMVFYTWKKTGNKGLTLMVAFACIPGRIAAMSSLFLKIDYDFLINLFIWVWVVGAAMYCPDKSRFWQFAGTISLLLFIFTWGGVPLFFSVVFIYSLFLQIVNRQLGQQFAEYAKSTFFLSCLVALVYVLYSGEKTLNIGYLGLFQPLFGLAVAVLLVVFEKLFRKEPGAESKIAHYLAIATLPLIAILAAFFFRDQLSSGFSFLFNKDPHMLSVGELQPIISFSELIKDRDILISALYRLSLMFFFFPLIFLANPGRIFSGEGRFVRDFAILFLLMGCYSVRYFRWVGLVIGFLNGLILFELFLIFSRRFCNSERKYGRLLLIVPLMVLHFVLSYPVFSRTAGIKKANLQALTWINENTPPTSGYYDEKRPEYSIFAVWSYGNQINYYARRPTIVNNTMAGFGKMSRLITAEDETQAYELCKKYGVRYFFIDAKYRLTDELVKFMQVYAKKVDEKDVVYRFIDDSQESTTHSNGLKESFYYWLGSKLAMEKSFNFPQAASRLRIVYCYEYYSEKIPPEHLIFQLVEGAKLTGKADAGTKVRIELDCQFFAIKRKFVQETIVGEDGRFEATVPYSNGYKNGFVFTGPNYLITRMVEGNTESKEVQVSEKAVIDGDRILLSEL